jgi:DNA mismatch repair protein MutL
MPIRLLSQEVSSRIAAGEVVERPASVVKELVENSLDAGATEVSVEISGGGVDYIRVTDNGCGIPGDEVELAFERFATSKVADARDLDSISTLGFRGEALPSIAAVSSVSLVTKSAGEDFGTRLDALEGKVVRKERHGAPQGTSVVVRHLFSNFPARRKFLRSTATETSRVQAIVVRYALAYPEVRFQLSVERSNVFSSAGSGNLREAVSAVYGLGVAEAMLELAMGLHADEPSYVNVSGMIGPPSLDRANRSYVSFFVNRRWVQNRLLGYALEQAYRGFLMEGRYPLAVVNIGIPHGDVDVNVHPAKSEVRFRREDQVFAALQQAVRQTLTAHSPVPEVRRIQASQPGTATSPRSASFWPDAPFAASSGVADQRQSPDLVGGHAPDVGAHRVSAWNVPTGVGHAPDVGAHSRAPDVGGHSRAPDVGAHSRAPDVGGHSHAPDVGGHSHAPDVGAHSRAPQPVPRKALPVLRVLGQVQNTYIVAEGPEGMFLIDQHAAHERVVFEKVSAQVASRAPDVQSLLEPVTVELDPRQQELMESQAELVSRLGFSVEAFGGQTYLLRGVPGLLKGRDAKRAFLDVLDTMAEGGGLQSWEERAAYSIACHSAIRAGKALTHQEMSELTRQLEECRQPSTCPHGRPTMIYLSSSHLEREFGRA